MAMAPGERTELPTMDEVVTTMEEAIVQAASVHDLVIQSLDDLEAALSSDVVGAKESEVAHIKSAMEDHILKASAVNEFLVLQLEALRFHTEDTRDMRNECARVRILNTTLLSELKETKDKLAAVQGVRREDVHRILQEKAEALVVEQDETWKDLDVDLLRQELNTFRTRCGELEAENYEVCQELEKLQDTLWEMEEGRSEERHSKDALEKKEEELDGTTEAEKGNTILEKQLRSMESEMVELKTRLGQEEQQRAEHESRIETLRREAEEHKNRLVSVIQADQAIQADIRVLESQPVEPGVAVKWKTTEALSQSVVAAHASLKELDEEVASMTDTQNRLEEEMKTVTKELNSRTQEKAQLQKSVSELYLKVGRLKVQMETTGIVIQGLERARSRSEIEVGDLRRRDSMRRDEASENDRMHSPVAEEMEATAGEEASLQLLELKVQLDSERKANDVLRETLKQHEEEIVNIRDELEEARETVITRGEDTTPKAEIERLTHLLAQERMAREEEESEKRAIAKRMEEIMERTAQEKILLLEEIRCLEEEQAMMRKREQQQKVELMNLFQQSHIPSGKPPGFLARLASPDRVKHHLSCRVKELVEKLDHECKARLQLHDALKVREGENERMAHELRRIQASMGLSEKDMRVLSDRPVVEFGEVDNKKSLTRTDGEKSAKGNMFVPPMQGDGSPASSAGGEQ